MISYLDQIQSVIQATTIHSRTHFSWLGHRSQPLHPKVKQALTDWSAHNYLVFNLKLHLYQDFYCLGGLRPSRSDAKEPPAYRLTPFVEELSQANAGQGNWKAGWEIRAIHANELVVYRDGLTLRVPATACSTSGNNYVGQIISVKFPKEFLGMSPGHYVALGDQDLNPQDPSGMIRLYLHLTPPGALQLVKAVTSHPLAANLPFVLKVLNSPERYTRCDSAVLYGYRHNYAEIAELLQTIYASLEDYCLPSIPVFTKRLALGIGLAEDPGQGESFGFHRCHLLAEGLVRAYEQGFSRPTDRLAAIEAQFAEVGISLETPYLNPGSQDCYDFTIICSGRSVKPVAEVPRSSAPTQINREAYLQTAFEIGDQIVRDAIWNGDRCNWLGVEPEQKQTTLTYTTLVSLGADLYGGTSGVALLLTELYAATQEPQLRRTALGAMEQAIARTETCPPPFRLGLYSGWLGIALAAARVGQRLDQPKLLNAAADLIKQTVTEQQSYKEFDLVSGLAGGISALVVLWQILDDPSLLDIAVQWGWQLIHQAERSQVGCSWRSSRHQQTHNLTGLSHGTSGVATALFEVFKLTGIPEFLTTARDAFAYEQFWFDSGIENWQDLRKEKGSSPRRMMASSFGTSWCHGAPGIALARLRAYELLHEEQDKTEALIALKTTSKILKQWLNIDAANYCLCHGIMGNAEVLLAGSQLLNTERDLKEITLWMNLPDHIADIGIQTCAKKNHQWFRGIKDGDTPGLMLGLSGIGYFYMRLYNSKIPSLLLLKREAFTSL